MRPWRRASATSTGQRCARRATLAGIFSDEMGTSRLLSNSATCACSASACTVLPVEVSPQSALGTRGRLTAQARRWACATGRPPATGAALRLRRGAGRHGEGRSQSRLQRGIQAERCLLPTRAPAACSYGNRCRLVGIMAVAPTTPRRTTVAERPLRGAIAAWGQGCRTSGAWRSTGSCWRPAAGRSA